MKQKTIALLLALTLVSAIAVSAFATEAAAPAAETAETVDVEAEKESSATEQETSTETTEEPPATTLGGSAAVLQEELQEATEGMILFPALGDMVKQNNNAYKALSAQGGYMSDVQNTINTLQSTIDGLKAQLAGMDEKDPDYAVTQGTLAATEGRLTALKSNLQQDPTTAIRQIENGKHQIIMGSENLFIMLVGLEQREATFQRQLAALDRTVEEMKLRFDMGQISQLQLLQVESGRAELASGIATLQMNIYTCKLQLEQLVGKELTGKSPLGTLPTVTEETLDALDFEADLKKVLLISYDVQSASDAESSAYEMAAKYPGMDMSGMLDGAHYTYKDTRLQVEVGFRSLYAQLQDCRQVLKKAEAALEVEKQVYEAQELKYQQGTVSKNAYLDAQDALKTANEAVKTAKTELFSTYNSYRWAVDRGILS